MPVSGTPLRQPLLTREVLRMAMRDYAGDIPHTGETNAVLIDVQFSDAEQDLAIGLAVDRYNLMTPVTNKLAGQLNRALLILGAISFLYDFEAARQVRNQVDAMPGGTAPTGVDNKAALYAQLSDRARTEFMQAARTVKTQENMENCYGGFSSGYPLIRWRY